MSVQAGIWNFDGRPVDRALVADFSKSLQHQGPDGESTYTDGSIALLYRPFHTTAESRAENQPYVSHSGSIFTWDGRLDNRSELIADLRRDLEAQPTDVAIIAAAFDRWGNDCFRRIIGDWAITAWKPEQRELIFAADFMAVRHIFYYLKADGIWWSTDLTPLVLFSGETLNIDDDYIAGYFAHYPDAHLTPYRQIREVSPGSFICIRNGAVHVERHWTSSPLPSIRYKTDAEYEEHFRHVFLQSVRRRLRSDSPILAELSGGLDSSSIVCIADDILAKEGAQATHLDTLTYYDKTEPDGDDWIYFPKIEERRGRAGHHIDVSGLGRAAVSLDYTDFDPLPGSLGSQRSHEAERANVVRSGGYRVVLSGIGGDEFLGGIPNPNALLGDLIVRFELIELAKQLMAWSLVKRQPWIQLLWQSSKELLPVFLREHLEKDTNVDDWIQEGFAKRTRLAVRRLGSTKSFPRVLPTRRSYLAGIFLMANKLSKLQSPGLAAEEIRYPYLDQALIEFILCIPATQVLRPGDRRSLMRRSLAEFLPTEILFRRTKGTAARTHVLVLERNSAQLQLAFRAPLSSALGYIDNARFHEALQAARTGKAIHIVRLLRTVSLEFWLRDLLLRRLINGAPEPQGPTCCRQLRHHSWYQNAGLFQERRTTP